MDRHPDNKNPKWILVRGLMRDKRHWHDFIESLSAEVMAFNVDVVAMDSLGNGVFSHEKSPLTITTYARALLEQLEGNDNNIIGLSMGGMIAIEMARLSPDKVSKVVVINTSAANLSPWFRRFNIYAVIDAYRTRNRDSGLDWSEATALKISSEHLGANLAIAKKWTKLRQENRVRLHNAVRQLWACACFKCCDSLQQPIFVFSGVLDKLVSPDCSQSIADHYRCQLIEFDNAGHDISLDSSAALIEQLKKVLL
ncbi:alpha/beta fold hydrolase [Shewanella kaireitica]|uniref:alpha/beta fold hydrolase n=1 Tax=Shewanella kaireitica TaxID=212021 RepID=UPI0020106483|nr:alpha/beta hydrolase [Shewanella kaireitica]MCL1094296.1 alpha/beta hydrolase [Shewanella kaireitica]